MQVEFFIEIRLHGLGHAKVALGAAAGPSLVTGSETCDHVFRTETQPEHRVAIVVPVHQKRHAQNRGGDPDGGQRQRLVIARALLRRPDLLILDEPTNHIDESGIANLMHRLERLPFHPAVIIISHEPRVLRHTSRAWRVVDGHLEQAFLEQRL